MSKNEKRLARIRNSQVGVSPDLLDSLLIAAGFIRVNGKGDHRNYRHQRFPIQVTIDPRRPVLSVYVKLALRAIDAAAEAETKEAE